MSRARLLLRFPSLLAGLAFAGTVGGVVGACFYQDVGTAPPPEGFYFPTGIVVSPGRNALYTANSDFDLQYNGGTVNVVDSTDATGLRGTLGPLLAGIRCSGGSLDACGAPNAPPGVSLQQFCNSIPMSTGNHPLDGACQVGGDCVSGYCLIGSDGVDGTCQPCQLNPDGTTNQYVCQGRCIDGTCMLDLATNQILSPAACTPVDPPFRWAATIGAFASGAVIALDPTSAGARLFVPVRGDPSITWFYIPDDRQGVANPWQLDCGQGVNAARCADSHRVGVDPYDNFRDLDLPVEPVGLDISTDGKAIVTAHQIATTPAIGLTVNQWQYACPNLSPSVGDPETGCPVFEYYLTGAVAAGPTEVVHIKPAALIASTAAACAAAQAQCTAAQTACSTAQSNCTTMPSTCSGVEAVCKAATTACAPVRKVCPGVAYQTSFAVTYNLTPRIDIFGVNYDAESSPARPFLNFESSGSITVNATGTDSRGLAIDTSARDACEAACAPTDYACQRACTGTPLLAYVANRAPPSLLLGQVQTTVVDNAGEATNGAGSSAFDLMEIYDTVPLTTGPSKVALGTAIGPDGNPRTLVFAVAFDTRFIHVYDPVEQQIIYHIRTGRGPQAIAFDTCITDCAPGEAPHAYLYVGHFTDSYIGVVDLDMRHGGDTFGTMFASVGLPLPPIEQVAQ